MRTSDQSLCALTWRKSSYSNADGGDCVEVGTGPAGAVGVRDSKDPEGPVLLFPAASWSAFLAGVPSGGFTV